MQIPRVYLFMGLLALGCRQPDRQPSVEASVHSAPSAGPAAVQPPLEAPKAAPNRCVVPMLEPPLPQAKPAADCPAQDEPATSLPRGQVRFDDAPSQPTIQVELAHTDKTRQRGLMYRTKLEAESGMLFMWNDESPRAFWMHNTCIPLDMLFIGRDGTITGVLEQVPVLNEESRGVPCPVAFVLEVNAGWVRGHKIAPGQHVKFFLP